MDQKPKARVKLTLKCNRVCPYCINKCKEYRARWKVIWDPSAGVDWHQYRSIVISGGEPTMSIGLRDLCRCLAIYTDGQVPVYLQTNGFRLTKHLVKDIDNEIDGIGLSVHDLDWFKHMLTRWRDILRVKPIRLYVEKDFHHAHRGFFGQLQDEGFTLRTWAEGESDPTEVIYLMDQKRWDS